jgi:hypothetical protein
LPPELRYLIWSWTFVEPRAVFIGRSKRKESRYIRATGNPPVALHVCHESRQAALRHYKLYFVEKSKGPTIRSAVYFQPGCDILYLSSFDNFAGFLARYPEINQINIVVISIESTYNIFEENMIRIKDCKGRINWKTQLAGVKTLLVIKSPPMERYNRGCDGHVFSQLVKQAILMERADKSLLTVKILSWLQFMKIASLGWVYGH